MLAEDQRPAGGVAGDRFGLGRGSGELARLSDNLERDADVVTFPTDVVTDDVPPAGAIDGGPAVVIASADVVGVVGAVDRDPEQGSDGLIPEILDADAVTSRHSGHVSPCPGKHRSHQRWHVVGHEAGLGGEHDASGEPSRVLSSSGPPPSSSLPPNLPYPPPRRCGRPVCSRGRGGLDLRQAR
jgi:hypothetical protein